MLRILMFFKFYFIFYCVLVRVTVYVGCLSSVINDDDDDDENMLFPLELFPFPLVAQNYSQSQGHKKRNCRNCIKQLMQNMLLI